MSGDRVASEDSGVVFHVHVMKTAGTTVNASLQDFYPPSSRYIQAVEAADAIQMKTSPQALFGLSHERKAELRIINAHMPLAAALRFRGELEKRLSITLLLRDGLERAVSHLRHLARHFDYAYSYRELLDDPVLGDFFLTNHQTRALGMSDSDWDEWQRCFGCLLYLRLYMKTPEARFPVSPVAEADLARAVSNLHKVDVLGLQSQFEDWWRLCHENVGWPLAHHAPMNVGFEKEKDKRTAPKIPRDVMDELSERNKLDTSLYASARQLINSRA